MRCSFVGLLGDSFIVIKPGAMGISQVLSHDKTDIVVAKADSSLSKIKSKPKCTINKKEMKILFDGVSLLKSEGEEWHGS